MTDEAVSPLRRRMIEDMTIRKFAPKARTNRAPSCTVVGAIKTPIRFMRFFCCARTATGSRTAAPPRGSMT